jgi:hypothetical protein
MLDKQGARETKGTLPWAHHGEYAMQILGRSLWVLTSVMAMERLSFLMDAANTVRNLLARHACSFPGCQTHPFDSSHLSYIFPLQYSQSQGKHQTAMEVSPEC